MFSSSLLYTSATCSSPIVVPHFYHHLLDDQQDHHHLLQESNFNQSPNNPIQDATTDYVLPNECTTITSSLDKSKAMNMMTESTEEVHKKIKRKPDNRSKVKTSQGLRDRRVRMSIGIARKFFDLQDLLGFDKPSRTLEWLLINSNKAILELSSGPPSTPSTSSDQATSIIKRLKDGHKTLSKHTLNNEACCKGVLKSSMKQKAAILLAKESRLKARARARARTVAKLSTANLHKNILVNNPEDMLSSDHQSYFDSTPLMKSIESESPKEEERQITVGADHQLQNYDSVSKSTYHHWSTCLNNSNLSLDQWNINCSYMHQGSSGSHQSNLSSRDYNITGRDHSWG